MFSTNAGLLCVELLVYGVAVTLSILFSLTRKTPAGFGGHAFNKLANQRILACFAVVAFVLIVRGSFFFILPQPLPGINDEFSYILAGETFSSGRLANPVHPMWKSLETFYVIQTPSYASMYPPGQGLAIAFGDLLTGKPWTGVYLSAAAMCGVICWMLQGWIPAPWALLGGLICALRLGIYSYWSESYWGGAVAAIGGALVFGAAPRLLKRARAIDGVVLATGLLILANSRPFEGLLAAAAAFLYLAYRHLSGRRDRLTTAAKRAAIPSILVLAAGFGGMFYYFARLTGHAGLMPYELHSRTYEITGPFWWQPLRKIPEYRYEVMREYHVGRQMKAFQDAHRWSTWFSETWHKAETVLVFYFWPAILPTIFAIPALWRDSKVRFALLALGIMYAGLCVEIWPITLHYHAPITAVTVLLLMQAIRYWRLVTWRDKSIGRAVSLAVPVFCAAMLGWRLSAAALHIPVPEHGLAPWFTVSPGNVFRAQTEEFLEHQPGLQLALVRYSSIHHADEEWVHNAADIDHSKVVWARYSDDQQNAKLLQYFNDRHVWLIEVGAKEGHAVPLTASPTTLQNR